MKTKQFISVFVLSIVVFSANALLGNKEKLQDKDIVTVVGVFDGYDADDGYSFLIKSDDDEEDGEETIYFSEISDAALKSVNLQSDEFIGKKFEITYEVTEFEEEDEDGYVDTFEKLKIIKIKKL
ncbi:hypothetical protein [Winogradskyella pulchriflava]|uniref:DUF3221 domain-containing protein n=1 Tax=Winogradskyella pulchriflava TaxID=1110688 RepID=A0ABV6Q565_9FLAO